MILRHIFSYFDRTKIPIHLLWKRKINMSRGFAENMHPHPTGPYIMPFPVHIDAITSPHNHKTGHPHSLVGMTIGYLYYIENYAKHSLCMWGVKRKANSFTKHAHTLLARCLLIINENSICIVSHNMHKLYWKQMYSLATKWPAHINWTHTETNNPPIWSLTHHFVMAHALDYPVTQENSAFPLFLKRYPDFKIGRYSGVHLADRGPYILLFPVQMILFLVQMNSWGSNDFFWFK